MREVREHVIGEFTYKIQQLGSSDGRKVMTRVIKVMGPVTTQALAGGADDDTKMAKAVGKLCELLSDADLDYLCNTFSRVTRLSRNDDPSKELILAQVIEDHFAGKYGTMLAWLWACFKTNYSNFLDELPAELKEAMAALMAPATDGKSTTGPTTASGASLLRAGAP